MNEKIKRLYDEMTNDCLEYVQERTDIKNAIIDIYWEINKENVLAYLLNYTPNDEYESTSREAWYLYAMNELLTKN